MKTPNYAVGLCSRDTYPRRKWRLQAIPFALAGSALLTPLLAGAQDAQMPIIVEPDTVSPDVVSPDIVSPEPLPTEPLPTDPVAPTDPLSGYNEALQDTTTNGRIAGEALLATCATGANGNGGSNNQLFQADCDLIVGGAGEDVAGSTHALTDIAADQISAQNSVAVRTAGLGVSMIQSRLANLRLTGAQNLDSVAVIAAGPFGQPLGGGASGDLTVGPFGGFLNARYVTGDADQTAFQPGYDFDGWSILGGLDYRFDDNLIGGVSLRYSDGDVDYDNNRGDMTGDSWGISLYGSYNMDNGFFVDGLIGYGQSDYKLKRRLNYTIGSETAIQTAKSDPSADLWNINVGAGYTLYKDAWSITPSARLNYLQNDVDSYRERMSDPTGVGGAMALSIDSQTFTSFTSDLGVQVARAISHSGGVIVPQLRIGWVHEFENGQEQVGARFVNDINSQPLFILTDEPVRDYADLSVGVSAQFANGRSAFLSYNTLLGYNDVTYNAINAGVRLEF
jgi:outer membrane lipase/esterase